MYEKIIVPLDGSKLAESVLPHVEEIATKCGGEVTLITVTERIQGFAITEDRSQPLGVRLAPQAAGKQEKAGQKYLTRVAEGLKTKGVKVKTEVLLGNPAEEIIINAKTEGGDLIIIASHGRSGLSRWTHGSVADKVLKATHVPVLMVRALNPAP